MKKFLNELSDFLDSRGVTVAEFIRLCLAFITLAGIVGVLSWGAIMALLQ
mgnify:CR=1 FL=1